VSNRAASPRARRARGATHAARPRADYHEFHFWLAVSLYGLGEIEPARRHLTQAMKNRVTTREQALYAAKLRSLSPAQAQPP
jgi:hypothetical protein